MPLFHRRQSSNTTLLLFSAMALLGRAYATWYGVYPIAKFVARK